MSERDFQGSLLSVQLASVVRKSRGHDACARVSSNGETCGHASWAHNNEVNRGCHLPGTFCMCTCLELPASVMRLAFDPVRYEALRKEVMGT